LQAALLLGLRATRRPAGYWDSLEVMDAELDAFVAGEGTNSALLMQDVCVFSVAIQTGRSINCGTGDLPHGVSS
jgi:hypothetical protein